MNTVPVTDPLLYSVCLSSCRPSSEVGGLSSPRSKRRWGQLLYMSACLRATLTCGSEKNNQKKNPDSLGLGETASLCSPPARGFPSTFPGLFLNSSDYSWTLTYPALKLFPQARPAPNARSSFAYDPGSSPPPLCRHSVGAGGLFTPLRPRFNRSPSPHPHSVPHLSSAEK